MAGRRMIRFMMLRIMVGGIEGWMLNTLTRVGQLNRYAMGVVWWV